MRIGTAQTDVTIDVLILLSVRTLKFFLWPPIGKKAAYSA